MARLTLVIACALALVLVPTLSKPWYQGGKSGSGEGGYSKFHIIRLEHVRYIKEINSNPTDGLPDCAPGKCPRTAEISPIQCSSDPAMYFNNGYPTVTYKKTYMYSSLKVQSEEKSKMFFCRIAPRGKLVTRQQQLRQRATHAGRI